MHNYSIYTLKTKLEFTNLYQYLSEKDYKQLEQQILCHSYHTPICTWNGIVITGIEAYELFRKHSIPFRIKRLHFSSKEDVISWICTDQLKREDLTNINKKYLIGKKYDAEKILVSRQLSSTNKSHISGASIAAKKISEECNVAMATVYKYSAYSSALDIIDEKVPDLVKRVRSGQLWISQANIIELSGLSKEQLLSLNNYLLAEKIGLSHIVAVAYKSLKQIRLVLHKHDAVGKTYTSVLRSVYCNWQGFVRFEHIKHCTNEHSFHPHQH